MNYGSIIGALVLSIFHWQSEKVGKHIEKYHDKIISFSSGLFATYIFMFLLPEAINGQKYIGNNVYLLMLSGFVAFHIAEKYVYQHITNKKTLLKDLAEIHAIGFFIEHFLIGMVLFFALNTADPYLGAIIIAPLLTVTISSAISLNHLDEYFKKTPLLGIILAFAPLLGNISANFLDPEKGLYYSLFSFAVGSIMYIIIRDMTPEGKTGRIIYFLIGLCANLILIISLKTTIGV